MLVVADSSPLHYLIEIGHVAILKAIFSRVVVPEQVAEELTQSQTPDVVRAFMTNPPSWLEVRKPDTVEEIESLDLEERAANSLACQLRPDFLLIDERAGRQEAVARKLSVIGTVGVLERGAEQGLLDLREAFERLRRTRFHVADSLLDQTLLRFEASRKNRR